MVKRLVLASHNAKKIAELGEILAPLGYELTGLSTFPGAPEPEETGETFAENAVLKAVSAMRFTGLSSLADDSGLVVDALSGEPGVRSARFAGTDASDIDNNRLLLERLYDVPEELRTARFVCVIALAVPDRDIVTFRGECEGRILAAPQGVGGFGYDPLFFSPVLEKSFAEAAGAEKNRISHRGKAIAALTEALENGEW